MQRPHLYVFKFRGFVVSGADFLGVLCAATEENHPIPMDFGNFSVTHRAGAEVVSSSWAAVALK